MNKQTAVDKKERPIIFSASMVKAILEGRKTQTRRIIKPPVNTKWEWLTSSVINKVARFAPSIGNWWTMAVGEEKRIIHCGHEMDGGHIGSIKCPYGQIGDRLWVRETWALVNGGYGAKLFYKTDETTEFNNGAKAIDEFVKTEGYSWKPSIHMKREYSRITLEITNIRVERIQAITIPDIKAEGIELCSEPSEHSEGLGLAYYDIKEFKDLWNKINSKRGYGWAQNPWVWCISFKKVEGIND